MKVTLLKPLTFEGKPREIGEEIEVDEPTAAWLADPKRGVIAAPVPSTKRGRERTENTDV